MFKIIKTNGWYWVLVQKQVKVFWFFTKTKWVHYDFEGAAYWPQKSYHEALQKLLLAIEKDLNLKYMDDHEMRN